MSLCCAVERPLTTMPVPAMSQPVDHQKRFQAAVDVIHNLPKDGSYRPSYEVMLRFYSLYKQAVFGPCQASRPGFWDPVGRYKWDAWSSLGEMSSEKAMAEYVEEMKKVAQEIIDTVPMNEKTASVFHHFEPLYMVIHDMPRPPGALLSLLGDVKVGGGDQGEVEEDDGGAEGDGGALDESTPETAPQEQPSQAAVALSSSGPQVMSEGRAPTSDSESEVFCDTVELLDDVKAEVSISDGFHNGHSYPEHSSTHTQQEASQATQVGAGQGGEGAEDGKGPPMRRSRDAGREATHHGWRERGGPPGSPRRAGRGRASGSVGGAGRGGGDGAEGGPERLQDTQVQEQIVLALRRLREDMRSVMERLEVVERLAAAHAQSPDWRPCPQCGASNSTPESEDEKWWPFDVSGRTVLLLLLWPLAAQGLVFLLRRAPRKNRGPV